MQVELLKLLLGVPLFLLVGVMLFHGLVICWGFASDCHSKFGRIVARSGFVLVALFVVAVFVSRIADFFSI